MRNPLITSLAVASATLASAGRLECLYTRSQELSKAASCGYQDSLNNCFSHIPLTTIPEALISEVEKCFVNAGCTDAEAEIEAFWVLQQCDKPTPDLRRNLRGGSDPAKPVIAREPLGAMAARAAMPVVTAAMHEPRQANDATPVTTTNERASSPSPCFTDKPTSVKICPSQPPGSKLTCHYQETTVPVCREELICRSDNQGNPSCMWKQTEFGTDGTIIAIIFASAVAISIVSVCFMCCKERREQTRLRKEAEAAKIAKEAKIEQTVAAKRPGVSVTGGVGASAAAEASQPLMYQGGAQPGNPFGDGQDHPALR